MIYLAIITCKPALSDLHVIRKTSILGYCSDIRKNIIKEYCSDNRNYDLFGYNYAQASVFRPARDT